MSYWKLDGETVDSVGANTLTNENGITFVPAKLHSGANMLSISQQDFVVTDGVQTGLNFVSGAPFSMSIWVKPILDSANSFDKDFIAKTNGTAGAGYMLSIENGGRPFCRVAMDTPAGRLAVNSAYNDHAYYADTEIDDNNWHHVSCVYDGTTLFLYVDGVLWADRNVGAQNNTSTENFYIGFRTGGNTHDHFDGQIDEVGVWNRALSASEVTDLYTSYSAPINTAPVTSGVATSTNEDSSTSILLLGSDTDNDPLTFATSTSPAHGTLSALVGSTTTYMPDPNYTGSDSFEYTVSDGIASATGTVTIAVSAVNDAPIIGTINNQTATSGDTVIFTATSTDVDGGTPVYGITSSSTSTTATINPATGEFSWDTAGVAAGSYLFGISVNDGAISTTTTATITLLAAAVALPTLATPSEPGDKTNAGSGVVGAGPLSVGYQNNPNIPIPETINPSRTVVTIPSVTPAPKPSVLASVAANTPSAPAPSQTQAQLPSGQNQNKILSSVLPENLLTKTNPTNQLASVASSGLKLPLWLCGAGGLVAAGVGAWWWLGLAL